MSHSLAPPASPADWAEYHAIRRAELFEARGRVGVYREDHPDEFLPGNRPLLLRAAAGGPGLGTVRLDEHPDGMILRLVAVRPEARGRGLGRVLVALVEEDARAAGITCLMLNAAPEAVGFWRRMGWAEEASPDHHGPGGSDGHPQMVRRLG